jgi:hypothetical protein
MQIGRESYPDKIRLIADELSKFRDKFEVDHSVEKLRMIANELELSFKKPPRKKT